MSSARPHRPAKDLGVKLGEFDRGRGQCVRLRWKVLERDDGSLRPFFELRLWSLSPDGWVPSRYAFRVRPEELDALADAVEAASDLADEFDERGGAS